jgi:F-box and WD-40 domain protein 1/11
MLFPEGDFPTSLMSPSDSSLELAPRRRSSLLTKSRPKTAIGVSRDTTIFERRRHSGLPALHPDVEDYLISSGQMPEWAKEAPRPHMSHFPTQLAIPLMADPSFVRPLSPVLQTPRRKPSISESVKHGFSELRSLGRRMSKSVRGKRGKIGLEAMLETRPPTQSSDMGWHFSMEDTSRILTRPKSRGWLRTPSTRRRPSLPLMNLMAEPMPPRYSIQETVPGSSRGPLVLSGDWQSGAGARAAAAAQNEAMQAGRSPEPSADYLSTSFSSMKLARDSESGIGIVMHDRRGSTMSESDIVRIDPSSVLPPELVEAMFCFLDPMSLLKTAAVSKDWRKAATSQAVWRQVFKREYANLPHSTSKVKSRTARGLGKDTPDQDWRKMYKVRYLIDQRWSNQEAAAIYLKGHKDSVYCVQFDEQKIITGSRDNTIRVWDTHTYQCIRKLGNPNNPRERHELPFKDPQPIGVQPLYILDTKGPDPAPRGKLQEYHTASILCLQYDDDILVSGSSDFTSIVWDIKNDYRPIHRLRGHNAGVLDVCIDDQRIITCSKDTTIKIWDRFTGKLLRTLRGHRGPVNAVQVRGNLLASASGDGMSKLWRLEDGMCIKEFSSQDRGLACVEFSEDGRRILSGGNDMLIYEFDAVTGNTVRQMEGHQDLVRSLHLDSANHRIISGSYDLSIKVWNTEGIDKGPQIDFQGWTTSWMLSAKSDYRKIVSTSQDGRVLVCDFGYGIEDVGILEG